VVPDFNDMVSLVGSVACFSTGFVLPPLMYLKVSE
jgi:hypothetical protein